MPKLARAFSQDNKTFRVVTNGSGKDYSITLEVQAGVDAMGAPNWQRVCNYQPYEGTLEGPTT